MTIVPVNPFRCRMWALHDRIEDHLTEESCKHEIESFINRGQVVPALGRRLKNDPDFDVELIYGARRLFVARSINKPLLVELRAMTDREAIIAMDIENRQRADVSPYERGLSYARWLRCGHFNSQGEIARELRVSESQVSRLLKVARLPAVLLNAFGNPVVIREEWGLALSEALENESSREATIRTARSICAISPRPSAREVFKRLLAASVSGRRVRPKSRDEVVKDDQGVPIFRIRQQNSFIALLLPLQKTSADAVDEIKTAITTILGGDFESRAKAATPAGRRESGQIDGKRDRVIGLGALKASG